jgi:phospholipid transport system substrate-binding protein
MKTMMLCVLVLGWSFISVAVAATADSAPDALVRTTVNEVLTVIKQNKDTHTLRKLAEQKVLPHFDFTAMTRLAVGKAWRTATPQQQQALERGFRALLVNTYTNALSQTATGQETVDVKPLQPQSDQGEVTVKTVVNAPGKQPTAIDYRMEKAGGRDWKVVDVVVENISLITNYRGTFNEEINRSGIDGLIKTLDAKNQALDKG